MGYSFCTACPHTCGRALVSFQAEHQLSLVVCAMFGGVSSDSNNAAQLHPDTMPFGSWLATGMKIGSAAVGAEVVLFCWALPLACYHPYCVDTLLGSSSTGNLRRG